MAEIPAYNVPLHWNGDAYWAYRDGYEAGYVRGSVEPQASPAIDMDALDRHFNSTQPTNQSYNQ